MNNVRNRVERLEDSAFGDDCCPGCGFRPGVPRTMLVCCGTRPREVAFEQPGRPRCQVCGDFKGPLRIIDCFAGSNAAKEASCGLQGIPPPTRPA